MCPGGFARRRCSSLLLVLRKARPGEAGSLGRAGVGSTELGKAATKKVSSQQRRNACPGSSESCLAARQCRTSVQLRLSGLDQGSVGRRGANRAVVDHTTAANICADEHQVWRPPLEMPSWSCLDLLPLHPGCPWVRCISPGILPPCCRGAWLGK